MTSVTGKGEKLIKETRSSEWTGTALGPGNYSNSEMIRGVKLLPFEGIVLSET